MTEPSTDINLSEAKQAILRTIEDRAPDASICPSDAARKARPEEWREVMDTFHDAVEELHAENRVVVTQGGEIVDPTEVSGPIRVNTPDSS